MAAPATGMSGFSKIVYPAQPQPPNDPVLSSTPGGSILITSYYVQTTYLTLPGETLPSAEVSLSVAANSLLVVQSPPQISLPFAASLYQVYVGTSPDTEELQTGSGVAIGTDWTEPTTGLLTDLAPPAEWIANTLVFKHPATKIPAFKYDAVRHDNVASSGVYEAIYERTDEFIEFDMEWVDNDGDITGWNDFIRYGLQGGAISYYQDASLDSYQNCTLWDSKWDAKWKSLGRYQFHVILRVLAS